MTRNKFIESIRLFAGLSALALASAACAPTGANLSEPQAQVALQTAGPAIDESVETRIASNGEARVHVRVVEANAGLTLAATSAGELPPEIISLLSRLPEGSFRVEEGVEGQPEALGTLTREGLAAIRFDSRVEFVAEDRIDDLIY